MLSLRSLPLALTLALPLCAQASEPIGTDPPQTEPTSRLLARLKARGATLDDAAEVVTALTLRATRDRLQAAVTLRATYLRKKKDFDKALERATGRCEAVAVDLQKQRLGRDGDARVAELRAAALEVTRSANLSKERIKADIDPRVEELRQLLLPAAHELVAADGALAGELQQLRDAHAELREWFSLYRAALDGLELHPDAEKHFKRNPVPPQPGGEAAIDDAIALCAFAGLPMAAQDKKALQANDELRAAMDEQEFLGTLELNRLRYLLGLRLLQIDAKLGDAARDHSKDMHTLGFFSHTSPIEGKRGFGQRAANFGTSASAENIYTGGTSGKGAISGWWYSPGHHKNMLGGHRRTGLGRHEGLWTQMFGG